MPQGNPQDWVDDGQRCKICHINRLAVGDFCRECWNQSEFVKSAVIKAKDAAKLRPVGDWVNECRLFTAPKEDVEAMLLQKYGNKLKPVTPGAHRSGILNYSGMGRVERKEGEE